MLNIKSFLASITPQSGVYQMLDESGTILYIGKARNLKKRLSSYFSSKKKDIKTEVLLQHVKSIDITVTHSENDALLLECNLIKKHRPHYNVLFRDDKSYPYILITNELYPRITLYRGPRKNDGLYFGPFPNTIAVRETIHLIEKLFKLRDCTNSFFRARSRPCMQYQINRCTAPCVKLISPEHYQQNVQYAVLFLQGKNNQVIAKLTEHMEQASARLNYELAAELRDHIQKLREIQARQHVSIAEGDIDVIGLAVAAGSICIQLLMIRGGRMLGSRAYFPKVEVASSAEEILMSFITQHYLTSETDIPKEIIFSHALSERDWLMNALREKVGRKVVLAVPMRGERKKWLEMADKSAQQSVNNHLLNKAHTGARFDALQELLQLAKPPQWIECFDISHSMGEATVGACVVFNREGPVKSNYRRFNVTNITPGDDPAAMRQVLLRRYQRLQAEEARLPDVLLIDGGLPQLNTAKKILSELQIETIYLVGVAKGTSRKPGFETLFFTEKKPIHTPPDSLALHLIQQIRDEAHRFAITGHRLRRDKKRVTSVLESIPGIGAKRRRELLRHFGGIQALNRASLDDIAKVPGIHAALAQRIFTALHTT